MKLSDFSFRRRIVAGFALLIGFSLIIGMTAIFEIRKVSKFTQLLYEHPFTVRNNLAVINAGIIDLHRATEEVAFAETYEDIEKAKNEVRKNDSLSDIAFAIIEKQFLGDKNEVKKTGKSYDSMVSIVNKIILLKQSGNDKEAKYYAREVINDQMAKLDSNQQILSNFALNKAQFFYNNALKSEERSSIFFIVTIIILLTSGTAISLIISNSVSQPIRSFIKELRTVFNKKYETDFISPDTTEQEIFERALNDIKESHSEIQTLNEELKANNEELNTFNEELEVTVESRTEQLKASEKSLVEAQKMAKIGHYSFNITTGLWTSSVSLDEIFGIDENYLRDVPGWLGLINPEHTEMMQNYLQINILTNRDTFDKHYKIDNHKNGKTIWVHGKGTLRFNEKNDLVEMFGTIQDINEQKLKDIEIQQTNEELSSLNEEYQSVNEELFKAKSIAEHNEEKLKSAQQIAHVGSWFLNIETDEMDWSDEEYRIFGLPVGCKITNSQFMKFIHPDFIDEFENSWANALTGKPFDCIFKTEIGGHVKWIYEQANIQFDTNNKPLSARGTSYDITQIKKTEIKLQKQVRKFGELNSYFRLQNVELKKAKEAAEESSRLKTEFLHNVSHEVRTPLNGIMGFSNLLVKNNLTEEKKKFYSQIIVNNSKQLLNIIDDILEISRLETKQVTVFKNKISINSLVSDLFLIFEIRTKEKNLKFTLRKGLSDRKSFVYSDDVKLRRILNNLLSNAVKFTNFGFIEFGYQLVEENIEFYVKDSGVGILPENFETIFQRFSQEEKELSRKSGGLGLGLSIAKESAELLGGQIRFESEKGSGTTFFVSIPYLPAYTGDEESGNDEDSKPTILLSDRKYKVLVAEDNEVNFTFFRELINDLNYNFEIFHAENGVKAVELCRLHPDFDLIFMDLKMPEMNGFEASKIISNMKFKTPIIALTAYSTIEEREKAKWAGCSDFITKPIDNREFGSVISKYIS
jgi:signal transduction histidine kinase